MAIGREICVYLDPETSEDLLAYSIQEHVSLKFLITSMFKHGFQQWKNAKMTVAIGDEDRKNYRRTSKN